ncbi:MAG: ABC transporter ATP-binding protein [Gemmataceae bacterium]|nr:ABC transporter ATP-binding protein [Gemmataceae bacterium]
MVEIVNLFKSFGETQVLRGVSLTIEPQQSLGILGKSGSGKSTLLHLIGGLDEPTSGIIRVAGVDLGTSTSDARARFRLTQVGIVFQAFHLIPSKNTLENVELPLTLAGYSRPVRRRMAQEALDSVGLSHRVGHYPNQLSGGERQRVAIARAIVHKPILLLADEPTGNLDSATGATIMQLLKEQTERTRATRVMVTHDEELAKRSCDRIVRMQDGLLV